MNGNGDQADSSKFNMLTQNEPGVYGYFQSYVATRELNDKVTY